MALLAIAFVAGRSSTQKERSQQQANLIVSRDSTKHYAREIEGLNYNIAQKNAMILTKDQAIAAGLIREEYLKELHLKDIVSIANLEGAIRVLRDSLALQPGTVIITVKDTSGITNDYVRIPFTLLDIKEPYLTLKAGMHKNHTAWFDLKTPVSGKMTIGYQRSGFLKTQPVGLFTSLNPYLTINQMDIVIIQEKRKWHSKWWVHAGIGIITYEGIKRIVR